MNSYNGNGRSFADGFGSMMVKIPVVIAAVWFIVRTVATVLATMGN